jgi:hypothetical protein
MGVGASGVWRARGTAVEEPPLGLELDLSFEASDMSEDSLSLCEV